MDYSMGKDNKIFETGIKNMLIMDKGLTPHNLGKNNISLFLEQFNNMAAYPCHTNHKTSESLRDFVEAVTDLSNVKLRRKACAKDIGWKNKYRNSMDSIKYADAINTALSYLLEARYAILETCQGEA